MRVSMRVCMRVSMRFVCAKRGGVSLSRAYKSSRPGETKKYWQVEAG